VKELNVAIIGCRFMGKAHSNAWTQVRHFFEPDILPVLKVACDLHEEPLRELAQKWGWESSETDWRKAVHRDDVDIVDIAAPTYLHHEIAVEAAQAGKHIFCEKPMTLDYRRAVQMRDAVEKAGVTHYLNHNYRRCPAVRLARQFIEQGRIGRIFHWRGAYLQSWIVDPQFPLTWQLRRETAGSGPHHDLNSHLIDLARYLVGEIATVSAMTASFIPERPLPNEATSGAFQAGAGAQGRGPVTVEDAAFLVAEFENGALGSFEATRFAPGRKNYNHIEIYGSKGSLAFNLERLNELQFFSVDDPECAQGFRTILVTESSHPYVSHWWPPGHIIGYEHTFVHAVADFLQAISEKKSAQPNFADGVKVMQVIDAGLESARTGRRVAVSSIA
jgi:predicted dehydrogenase